MRDVIVAMASLGGHIQRLKRVFPRLRDVNVKTQADKNVKRLLYNKKGQRNTEANKV